MNGHTVWTILRKELLATMRDRRTLIMMIGVPLLLYPALLLIGVQAALFQHQKLDRTLSRVAIVSQERPLVERWLRHNPKITLTESRAPLADLRRGKLDAVVTVEGPVQHILDSGEQVCIKIQFDGAEYTSRDAEARVERSLKEIFNTVRRDRLEKANIEEEFVSPLEFNAEDVASPEKTTGNLLGIMLPLFMVMTIALGAFYPAVDLTAGEKERGTFETLLATPASKLEIVAGKFVAVFLLAMIAGIVNLISMAGTFMFAIAQLGEALSGQMPLAIELRPGAIAVVVLVTVPLAFCISALMMSAAVFARSFKEAQNYLTPLFLLIVAPAGFAALPGVELSGATVFVPIANVVLLFKDLMTGKAELDMAFEVLLATGIYALLALLLGAWLFQREEVVLSEERGIPLTLRRAELQPRDVSSPGYALGIFAMILLAIFYLGAYMQGKSLLPGLLATEWGLIFVPVMGALWFARIRPTSALQLRRPRLHYIAGALLSGPATVILLMQVGVWSNEVLPVPPEYKTAIAKMFAIDGSVAGFATLLAAVALTPAVCEECLFRGLLLTGLRPRLGMAGTILLTGFLFGIFHLSIYRMLPAMLMGTFLGYIAWRSGSILPGMLVHALSNGLAILLGTGFLPKFISNAINLKHIELYGLPGWILGITAVVFACGVFLIELGRGAPEEPAPSDTI